MTVDQERKTGITEVPFGRTELSLRLSWTEFGALASRGGPEGPCFQGMPEKSFFSWLSGGSVFKKNKKNLKHVWDFIFALTIGKSFLNDSKRAQISTKKTWETSESYDTDHRKMIFGWFFWFCQMGPRRLYGATCDKNAKIPRWTRGPGPPGSPKIGIFGPKTPGDPSDDLGRSFGIIFSPKFQHPTIFVNHFHVFL